MSALIFAVVIVCMLVGFAFLLSPAHPVAQDAATTDGGLAARALASIDSSPDGPQTSLWIQDAASPQFLIHEGLGSAFDDHQH